MGYRHQNTKAQRILDDKMLICMSLLSPGVFATSCIFSYISMNFATLFIVNFLNQ